jgi:lipopolysaccharide export LptBFGC system permease protein LptF
LIGTLVGIGFHIFSQIMSYLGLLYRFDSFLSAAVPVLIFLMLGVALQQRAPR